MNELWTNGVTYVSVHGVEWATGLALGLVIVVVGWALARLAASATRRAMKRTHAASLGPMVGTLVRLTVSGTSFVMAADQVGLDVTTVLAGAGVLGLAVGFGAQTLVRDCISGFFLVVERVVEPGDWADIDGKFGQVESVGLRITQVRGFDGTLWHIPNGEVKLVGNMSREWVRAVAKVGVAYEADLSRGLQVLQAIGDEFAAERPELIVEPPVAQGVLELASSSVELRLVVKMKAETGELWSVERELRKRIKDRFDAEGIEIPFPRQVIYHRNVEQAA
ncbi:MAG: mechanosensitive ion channel family protein [Sandaracinaceae bacterium]|nr:mechanosensitive ion channel family protein [Sandaracinaceae bacterium]